MADNEAQKVEVKLEYENDEESLKRALADVQSQIRNATGTKNLVDKRINASKRYKGRANDLRQSQSLATKISDLHVREGELIGKISKKTTAPSDNVSSRDKNAETRRREQVSREASLEYRKVHDAEVLKQKAAEETAKIERDLEKERLRNQGKLDLEKQRSADKLIEQEAKAKQDKEKALAVQQLREDERNARQAADIESREKTKAARLEFDKEQEKRRNRALDLKEQAMKERKQEKKLAETRKKFSARNLGYIGKIAQKLERLSITRIARGILNAVINSTKQGVQDLYKWSQSNNGMFAKAVDSIKEDFRYISDIIGSIVGPFIETLAPIIRNIADAFAVAAERANQFFATLLGRNGYYRALRVAKQYAGIQNQLLGFDELNVLKGDNETGEDNFEDVDYDKKLSDIGARISKKSNSLIAIGSALLLTGHPIIGAGMLAAGAFAKYAAAGDNEDLQTKIEGALDSLNSILSVTGPAAFVLGAVLTLCNHPGIGIPLMVSTLAAGVVNWKGIVEVVKDPLKLLTTLALSSIIALGMLIALSSPAHFGMGLALMIAGGIGLGKTLDVQWGWLGEKVSGVVSAITGIVQSGWNWLVEKFNGFKEFVKNWIAVFKEGISTYITPIVDIVRTAVTSVMSLISPIFNTIGNIIDRVKSLWNWLRDTFDRDYSLRLDSPAKKAFDNYHYLRYNDPLGLGLFASGGTPTTGSLFYAGEAGPELVTSMNNQSTVYNEDQLTGSLASANSGVVTAVYDMANAVVNAIERKNTSISVNDVRSAINSQALRYGL